VVQIMMRTILGSAIGGLVAGAVALGAAQMRSTPVAQIGADPNGAYAMPVANTGLVGQGASVQCQPYQQPVVQRAFVDDREVATVTCVSRTVAPGYYPTRTVYADDMVTMPRARTVSTTSRPATRQPVSYSSQPDVRRESGRSWKKTAMIIGGSTGGGAGIGGLIGGKKGALIGAALGGGAATIYESTKRQ
jgi:hypothetical protein